MKKILLATLLTMSIPAFAKNIISFETMYGVDGPFVNSTAIRGVKGDELPWEITSAVGNLTTDGKLNISVKGLVFADDPSVPPELRGINDEETFRAIVSCIAEKPKGGGLRTVNILTAGFPANRAGDSEIMTSVALPEDCVAPIIFVMSGSENRWFSVTGAEVDK